MQPYTEQPLILYQLETVPVPIIDKTLRPTPTTELQIKKPYIGLNSETYINISQQELATGESRLSRTAVKPDSHLAQIFVAKFLCIIKLIIIIG